MNRRAPPPVAGIIPVAHTSMTLARLGFGVARIAGGPERSASIRLIETALRAGICHFDTAPSYGDGESEQILGEVLRGVSGITVTTKFGIARPKVKGRPSLPRRLYRQVGRPVLGMLPQFKARLLAISSRKGDETSRFAIKRPIVRDELLCSLEESSALLGRAPDIFLIHEPDQFILDDSVTGILNELQAQGLFRAWGTGCGAQCVSGPGQIAQGLWAPGQVQSGQTHIYHGVLRSDPNRPAAERLRLALSQAPGSAFLFSASTQKQITSLVSALA